MTPTDPQAESGENTQPELDRALETIARLGAKPTPAAASGEREPATSPSASNVTPYNSDADRINMLLVYLSAARDILGSYLPVNKEKMYQIICRQLAHDTARAAAPRSPATERTYADGLEELIETLEAFPDKFSEAASYPCKCGEGDSCHACDQWTRVRKEYDKAVDAIRALPSAKGK